MVKTRKAKRINPYIGWLIIGLIGVANFLITQSGEKGFIWLPAIVNRSSSIPAIWMHSGIYIDKGLQPKIVALDGKLFILGSDDISKTSSIIAFDSANGNTLWRLDYNGMSIAQTGSTIIVGGTGEVIALDIANGNVRWKTNVLANVVRIIPQDNFLYVIGAGSSRYYVLDATSGSVLKKADEVYSNWEKLELKSFEYGRTGDGDIVATNQVTGQEVWRNKANTISNLTIMSSSVYALSQDGNLLRLDSLTGSSDSLIKFTPSPLNLYSNEKGGFEYAFYLAADNNLSIMFSYFGDSAQLFAHKLE